MNDREIRLVFGGLLHDVGKVIYRQGDDRRKHSQSGYEFLKNEIGIEDEEILDAVLYHHAERLKNANLEKNSIAYVVYLADNIASSADRRQKESEDIGFEISTPLQSVFNILNGNHEELYYEPKTLDSKDDINYPIAEKKKFDEHFYAKVKRNLSTNLNGLEWTKEYINSLLEVLEANLSYVPSSTAQNEMADISLYDHVKLTAALASCIENYLSENGIADYRERLFLKGKDFYEEEAFILYSMDVSGIQDFIYTITSKNALKTLRARSFYLEIMMEHIIDCLLQELHLSRANLIYSGGGHCYILMPNTKNTVNVAECYVEKLNHWLMDVFHISLYVAEGYAVCSANTLKNVPQGSYSELFRRVGAAIAKKKSHRYSADDIKVLNSKEYNDYARECKVCKRIGQVDQEGICPICKAIESFSGKILYDEFFTVTRIKREGALPLPGDYYLEADNETSLKEKMLQDESFVRAYSKNQMYTGKHIATKLWVGDYTTGKTFEEYAAEASGIDRIGIIRADVDNLGHAFVAGFKNPKNQDRYITLSRTATLSRQLSLFFKLHINRILSASSYSVDGKAAHPRPATICYSGGDDLFIVGAWNEIIELAVDIRRDFEMYTQGTLSLSAGIGVYGAGYPISAIANEVADMEDISKSFPGKNAITIFPDGEHHYVKNEEENEVTVSDGTYCWEEFEQRVLGEKYKLLHDFFEISEERGMNFLYNLLELIRNRNDKINFARYVYLLSRLEPDKKASLEQKQAYREFASKMYQWIKNEDDSRQLKTAINLYAYLTREKEDFEDERE